MTIKRVTLEAVDPSGDAKKDCIKLVTTGGTVIDEHTRLISGPDGDAFLTRIKISVPVTPCGYARQAQYFVIDGDRFKVVAKHRGCSALDIKLTGEALSPKRV